MFVDSNIFEDLNAEHNFEYGVDEFLTDPEITLTASTLSEADP